MRPRATHRRGHRGPGRNPGAFLAEASCDPRCALWLGNEYMRIAYLECFSGISGDMFMGALVDAGVPRRLFEETVTALNVGARLEISRVVRSGISATKVDVYVDGEKDMPRDEFWGRQMAGSPPEAVNHDHQHPPHDEGLAREPQGGHGRGHAHP